MGGSSIWPGRQGNAKHEPAQKVQALSQSNTLKLFYSSDAATMAFHIAANNAMSIWEEDDDFHLGRIDHCRINMFSHMNCILFFFSIDYI